jgi:hypothetical protein
MWTPTLGPISELHYSKRFAKYLDLKQKYVERGRGRWQTGKQGKQGKQRQQHLYFKVWCEQFCDEKE